MKTYTWYEAQAEVEKLGDGWRMPRVEELVLLIDYSRYDPACADQEMQPHYYWSSTTYASLTNYAWYVNFYSGIVNGSNKSDCYYVRPVRDTENGIEWGKTL
jgi:hypothetical protein